MTASKETKHPPARMRAPPKSLRAGLNPALRCYDFVGGELS